MAAHAKNYVRAQNAVDEAECRHEGNLGAVAGQREQERGRSRDRSVVRLKLIYTQYAMSNAGAKITKRVLTD